jgi:MtN3 and saliva related transmembrane protein
MSSWTSYGLTGLNAPDLVQESIGIAATVLSIIYRLPQMYKIYKTKKSEDISVWMLLVQNLSYLCYICYGIFKHDWIYISASLLSFMQNIIIYLQMRYYRKKDNNVFSPTNPIASPTILPGVTNPVDLYATQLKLLNDAGLVPRTSVKNTDTSLLVTSE